MSREDRGALVWIFAVGVVMIVLVALASALNLITLPWQYDRKRDAEVHSNAYLQGKVSQLSSLMANFNSLETKIIENEGNQPLVDQYRSEQKATVRMMWETYDVIPSDVRNDVVPSDIQRFLSTHPRGQ